MSIEELEEKYKRYETLLIINEITHGLKVNCEWRISAILKTGRLSTDRIAELDKIIEEEWRTFLEEVSNIQAPVLDEAAE